MSVVFRYPPPFLKLVAEFRQKFGEYYAPQLTNLVLSGDRVVGLILTDFTIRDGKSDPVVLREDVTFRYLFSARFKLKGYKMYATVTVENYAYNIEYVVDVIRLLREYGNAELDFWFLERPKEKDPVLGIGNNAGFMLIAPEMSPSFPTIKIDHFLSQKRKKCVLTDVDIQVPDHIIEKWIKELGLKL